MTSSKRFSMALAVLVLVVLTGAGSAFAQSIPFNVLTTPTDVANTGMSEVLGQVTMNADITCLFTPCNAPAGSIKVKYVGTEIDNTIATANIGTLTTNGIEVCETPPAGATTCNVAGFYLTGAVTVTNSGGEGTVSFSVNAVAVGVPMPPGYQVVVRGVRGIIAESPGANAGGSIVSQLTTSPSTIAGFQPTTEVVARTNDPLEVEIEPGTLIQCDPNVEIVVILTEGFNTAWVDHEILEADDGDITLNVRPLFGGRNNSHINIVITDLPVGVEIDWPNTITESGAGTGAHLYIIDQSSNGDEVEYLFATPDQGASDNDVEEFEIVLDEGDIDLSGTPDDFGSSTGQAQMYPPDDEDATNSNEDRPRYDHDLENDPGDDFLTVAACTTNLLFPWVANFAGLDTGLAISNTSDDPYNTDPQTGTCEVNLYPTDTTTNNGVALTGPVTITTSSIAPGSVWRSTMSGQTAFRSKAGYIIAICQFQYGHGFAFFTDNFGVGSPATAQGYLALIIPDPEITKCIADGNDRAATLDGPYCGAPSGEGLGQ